LLNHSTESTILPRCSFLLRSLSIDNTVSSETIARRLHKPISTGNCQPPPIPFETTIRSNDSDHKFLQHPFRDRGMPLPSRKKTRRGKHKKRACHTGHRHTPNAPDPILDCGGVLWCNLMTLLTRLSSLLTLMKHPPIQCVCL
jgi:hypothetical protein